jgi:hypothetical protein
VKTLIAAATYRGIEMNEPTTRLKVKAESAYIKDLHFTKCRACGSRDIVKFDVDTFCINCDWNSVVMDVTCGNFEKRIAIMNRNKRVCLDKESTYQPLDAAIEELNQDIVA